MAYYRNKFYIFLLFIIVFPYSINSIENVKVNLVGYPKFESFNIKLNDNSIITVNDKIYKTKKITVLNYSKLVYSKEIGRIEFSNILVKCNGRVTISCTIGDQDYSGDLLINIVKGKVELINEIPINDYFAGVLGAEMGESFPDEALKAQAIAIRTYYYKIKENYNNKNYNINNADGIDMVFRGLNFTSKAMYKAFIDTDSLFLTDRDGSLVLPYFHSTSGGLILNPKVMSSGFNDVIENPVVLIDKDKYGKILSEESPYFHFQEIIPQIELIKIIAPKIKIDSIVSISYKYFNNTKIVDFLGFENTSNKIYWIKAYQLISLCQKNGYRKFGSIWFNSEISGKDIVFSGYGYGHLCGMSQYSAKEYANQGASYQEILKKYYPDYIIRKILL